MKKVELFIVPNAQANEVKTRLVVDGHKINSKDNRLTNLVVYQPMRKWLNPYKKKLFVWEGLLPEMITEFNDKSIYFVFHGCKADYTIFRRSILKQQMKLNRNGGGVEVIIKQTDDWDLEEPVKNLVEILNDMWVEADNWGEDGIIKEIDSVKALLSDCAVTVMPDYMASVDDWVAQLQEAQITVKDDGILTVIPVDGSIPLSTISVFLTALTQDQNPEQKYLVINVSGKENDELLDAILALDSGVGTSIKYLENDGENYLREVCAVYYQFLLPAVLQKTVDILHMYYDHDTNPYLIDITNRLDDLFCIFLK